MQLTRNEFRILQTLIPVGEDVEATLVSLSKNFGFARPDSGGDHAVNIAEWVVFSLTGEHD